MRNELAYPIMITPFAQFVGVQAVMNVIAGDRYSVVPNEIKKYALGYFGKLLADIEPSVLEKIIANGSADIPLEPQRHRPDAARSSRPAPRRRHRHAASARDVRGLAGR